ncbi:MAG: sugar transferase [Anaerolineae bacterium]|nr:sugar transferase [Anaerolineae bacterium]
MQKFNPVFNMVMSTTLQFQTNSQSPKLILNNALKHVLDVVGALVGLVLLSPFFALIAVAIKRDSSGPVFYRGPRAAKGGGTFQILKFRTMYERPESYDGSRVTAQGDARITPLGKWLRDTKLNELPQLWNVLRGEMSLVGPRPEDPVIAGSWSKEVRQEILSVCPGITSPASVLYRNEEALLNNEQVMKTYIEAIMPSKMRLDQLYVRNRSFLLDLDVLLSTFLILIPRLGSYDPPEAHIFWGPISRVARRYMSWFTIDALVTFASFGILGIYWRTTIGPLDLGWANAAGLALGFALLFSLIGAIFGIQKIEWSQAATEDVFDLIPAAVSASMVGYWINYLFKLFPAGMMIMVPVMAFSGYVVVRYRSRLITGLASRLMAVRGGTKAASERVLIVGSGEAGQFASWFLNTGRNVNAFHVVGFADDDLYKQGVRIRGVNVLGQREAIPSLVADYDIGIIIFAIHNIPPDERRKLLAICKKTSAQILMLPDFLGALNILTENDIKNKKYVGGANEKSNQISMAWPRISSGQMDEWLKQLETAAQSGDISAVETRIQLLRKKLRSDDLMDGALDLEETV